MQSQRMAEMINNTLNLTPEQLKQQLSDVHDSVKLHPYRLEANDNYKEDYSQLLRKLSDTFWECIKDTQYKGASNMLHDFNSLLYAVRSSKSIKYLEMCIGVIHRFINTGKVDVYYTYYTGNYIYKSMNRLTQFIYNEDEKKYIPQYSKEEIAGILFEIAEFWKSGKPIPEYGMYSTKNNSYYTKYKNKYYPEEETK